MRQNETHIFTNESFDNTAMTLFSSLGWSPIRPAKSSSLRLQWHQKRQELRRKKIYKNQGRMERRGDQEDLHGTKSTHEMRICLLTPGALRAGP